MGSDVDRIHAEPSLHGKEGWKEGEVSCGLSLSNGALKVLSLIRGDSADTSLIEGGG